MAASKQFLLNYDSNILLPYTTLDCILSNENSDPDSAKATGIYAITDSLLKNIREFLSYHGEQAVTGLEIKTSQIDSSVANILGLIRVTSDDSGEVGTAEQFVKIYGLNLDNKLSSGYYLAKDGACHPIATQTSDVHDAYDVSIYIRPYEANDGTEDPIQSKIDINIRYDKEYIDVQEKQFYNKLAQRAKHSQDANAAIGASIIYESYSHPTPEDPNSAVSNIVKKEIGNNIPVQLVDGLFSAISGKGINASKTIQPVYIKDSGEIAPVTESIGANGTAPQPIYADGGVFKAITSSLGSDAKHIYMENGVIKETNKTTSTTKLIYLSGGAITESTETVGTKYKPVYLSSGQIVASDANVGGTVTPVYMTNGVITELSTPVGAAKRPMYFDPSLGMQQCSGNEGGSNLPIYISDGTFTKCAGGVGNAAKPIYFATDGFKECSATVGSTSQPVYMSGGVITEFKQNCATHLVSLTNGVFGANTLNKGAYNKPIYCEGGIFKEFSVNSTKHLISLVNGVFSENSSASAGSTEIPIYLSGGNFVACSGFDPSGNVNNVLGSDGTKLKWQQVGVNHIAPQGGEVQKYVIYNPTTKKTEWGDGNTTTAGTLDPSTDGVYYVVGIRESDVEGGSTFKTLTGAHNGENKGIYFKNYELFQTSDERLKTFTDDIDINFDNLATIKKGIYHWKDDPNKISDIGVTAQSLEALYPEIVDENNGTKTVAYNRLGVIALAAIDKLHLRVKELENEIKELKAELKKK